MKINFRVGVIPKIGEALGMSIPQDWDLSSAWPLLEKARSEGAIVMLKLDGGRSRQHYSVIISDGLLEDGEVIRTDADSIEKALAFVLGNYALQAWGIENLGSPSREFEGPLYNRTRD